MKSKVKFFSKNVAISKQDFNENCDKLNYQRKLIRDIEKKHKEWANEIDYYKQQIFQFFIKNFFWIVIFNKVKLFSY